jgi:hypothetical protein
VFREIGFFFLLLTSASSFAGDPTPSPSSSPSTQPETSELVYSRAQKFSTLGAPAFSGSPSLHGPLLPPGLIISASNGASRGGGNGLVCFPKESSWPSRLGAADDKAHAIPDDALPEIESIQMLDLNDTLAMQNSNDFIIDEHSSVVKKIIPPSQSLAQISASDWAKDPSGSANLLEGEFERYVGRYREAIPPIYQQLKWAQAQIPLANLEIQNAPIEQMDDFQSLYRFPENCVLSTVFNQARDGSDGAWQADSRLFFHPKHSFLSQVTGLIHERVYYLGRLNFYQSSNSFGTYFFTRVTLTSKQIYKDVIAAYNQIFGYPGIYVSAGQEGPSAWLNSLFSDVLQAAQGSRDPKILGPIYVNTYRPLLLQLNLLDEKSRKIADKNLTRYFVKGIAPDPVELFQGWPVNANESEIPLP